MLGSLLNGMMRITVFTVHEPPANGGTALERAERLLFVQDGFSWRAALFSPFYLLVRGEWLGLLAYVLAAAAGYGLLQLFGAQSGWFAWIFVLLNVIAGFEAAEIKRWSLARAGWVEVATVSGHGAEEAERRFFEAWLPSQPAGAQASPTLLFTAAGGDVETRMEAAVRRLSARLRHRFSTPRH